MGIEFLKKKDNLVEVTTNLLHVLNVKVHRNTIEKALKDHPEYPSLLSISDCLAEWGIPSNAYNIGPADYDVSDMLFPLIGHTKEGGGQFILVHGIKDGTVSYSKETSKKEYMPESDFLKIWDGIVLYAEPTASSGEPAYRSAVVKYTLASLRVPMIILAMGFILGMLISGSTASSQTIITLFFKTAGLVVSVLLLAHSIDSNNPFVQNLCSLGKKNNCNAILKSEAAKITSWLSWSEVGFFYFSGSLLALLIVPGSLGVLAILSFLSLPYTVYSITYQFKTNNWCVLCCAVQALLWLEAITWGVLLYSGRVTLEFQFNIRGILLLAGSFVTPIAIWGFLKPYLLAETQLEPLKKQLKKFKFNSELFNQALIRQPRFAVPDDIMPIILGNPEAETVITMVSNPFCGPCASAHKLLDSWLTKRDDLQLKVVFSTANHEDDPKTKVSRHLTALGKSIHIEEALNDWYNSPVKDYNAWAAKYPVELYAELADVSERQKEWCTLTEVSFTPTILINGYKLPEPYRLEDIKYLLS